MAKIGLSEGTFTLIPEGTHIFKIVKVNYKEDFGKLEITLETQSGLKHIERFSLLASDGTQNQGALNAFSYFAKTAMNDFTLKEIDHNDLLGHFIECSVVHETVQSKNDPGKTVTFARLTDKYVSEGWSEDEGDDLPPVSPKPKQKPESSGKPKYDLKAILG